MDRLKEQHIAPAWRDWLANENLDSFETWWRLELEEVDEGNTWRGGWSRVFRFEQKDRHFFVKRQSNHLSHAFLFKVPTFKIEFDRINQYTRLGIPCLDIVYFGWRKESGKSQAILVTEALDDYLPLNILLGSEPRMLFNTRKALCESVGRAISRLHAAGMSHFNLYPKHIYLRHTGNEWLVRFIDLETSRSNFGLRRRKQRDLETLSRRVGRVSRTDRLRTLLAYHGKSRVDLEIRKEISQINQRTVRKLA
ncbi:MAG TPA: lipopolysaccharide kinase InaA family protein [Pseudomonadales bacterium]|jgi:tRNA A-37 threonylcarbamoyl transferase component Bud32|nr:lipopolysaccharide kinase InaA family protein [Pseudomonadales bacterium]MDP6315615.1 lipopolysaccharide kinase InaA family protein [Pseudomonadales bacterium]MDP7316024.1 lipopolysaccharide kinase InaA family protein [Pseudomonadales bacterium]MDP7575496.1 lipopolysaccharide kinase InaA family protein [Pseudomonadales bacterium]HJL61146.1 lipopolysaccharide kinase InaA family protein [Pseudomonadales bacterium]|tara:strand:- start:1272 stop:2027 length:756 start_codon:yes stop_codon:yes gene_type:complete